MSAHGHGTDDEMHELNLEADYLDQKSPKKVNGRHAREHSDPDAQAMVIESLRSQIQDLFSQVTQLNTKLVKSYDRVSDLEDDLHVTSANLRSSTLKISNLELERTQHLSALSTGLLVEKDHVTAELTRLMEKATEEAARRGQAETARADIEQELDDLSAGLFDQANRMVAEARLGRAISERKADETEQALRGAEEVVGVLQAQMQALEMEKQESEKKVAEMRALVGKGKWTARPEPRHAQMRYLSSHLPYHEYLQFIAHLRSLRPSSPQAPAVTTLLPLPFLARLVTEDSDPTVRLDLAPSLNWLTRRSVLSAIHSGQLTVEPMPTSTLLEELAPLTIPPTTHHTHVNCALCGSLIFEPPPSTSTSRPSYPPSPGGRNGTWTSALKSLQTIATVAVPGSKASFSNPPAEPPKQVYIFRLASTSSSGLPVSLPISPQQTGGQNRPTIYPLCTSGWCLLRLRATCTLWAYVRTNVVEKVWEEEPLTSAPSSESHKLPISRLLSQDSTSGSSESQFATPAKKARVGISAIWGTMQRGLSGSKGDESPKSQMSQREEQQSVVEKREPRSPPPPRRLPPPPPRHPLSGTISSTSVPVEDAAPEKPLPGHPGPPPPLPKRNRTRESRPNSLVVAPAPVVPDEEIAEGVADETEGGTDPAHDSAESNLVSPPVALSRSESHDDFSTPTEELSPGLSRSPSPTKVSLPTSDPSTPMASTFIPPHDESKDEHEGDAAAATEEKPATEEAKPEAKPEEPPRAATPSAVPPPLPRRAAARRPISTIAPVPAPAPVEPPTASEEPSQVNGDPKEAEEPKTSEAEELKESEAEESKETSEESSPALSNEAPPLPTRDPTPEPSAAVTPISASSPRNISLEKLDEVELATPPEQHDAVDEDTVKDTASRYDDDSLAAQSFAEKLAGPSEEPDEYRHEDEADEDEQPSFPDEEGEEDVGTYVGEGTWEERTWKELARLREDMFYARMGCVR